MGVEGLTGAISNIHNVGTQCCVTGKSLVVDASALIYNLLSSMFGGDDGFTHKAEFCAMSGSTWAFAKAVKQWLHSVALVHHIKLILVFDGFIPPIKRQEEIDRQNDRFKDIRNFMKSGDPSDFNHILGRINAVDKPKFALQTTLKPELVEEVMVYQVKKFVAKNPETQVRIIQAFGEADSEMVALCTSENYYAILSEDSDFLIFDRFYIPLYSFSAREATGVMYSRNHTAGGLTTHLRQLAESKKLVDVTQPPYPPAHLLPQKITSFQPCWMIDLAVLTGCDFRKKEMNTAFHSSLAKLSTRKLKIPIAVALFLGTTSIPRLPNGLLDENSVEFRNEIVRNSENPDINIENFTKSRSIFTTASRPLPHWPEEATVLEQRDLLNPYTTGSISSDAMSPFLARWHSYPSVLEFSTPTGPLYLLKPVRQAIAELFAYSRPPGSATESSSERTINVVELLPSENKMKEIEMPVRIGHGSTTPALLKSADGLLPFTFFQQITPQFRQLPSAGHLVTACFLLFPALQSHFQPSFFCLECEKDHTTGFKKLAVAIFSELLPHLPLRVVTNQKKNIASFHTVSNSIEERAKMPEQLRGLVEASLFSLLPVPKFTSKPTRSETTTPSTTTSSTTVIGTTPTHSSPQSAAITTSTSTAKSSPPKILDTNLCAVESLLSTTIAHLSWLNDAFGRPLKLRYPCLWDGPTAFERRKLWAPNPVPGNKEPTDEWHDPLTLEATGNPVFSSKEQRDYWCELMLIYYHLESLSLLHNQQPPSQPPPPTTATTATTTTSSSSSSNSSTTTSSSSLSSTTTATTPQNTASSGKPPGSTPITKEKGEACFTVSCRVRAGVKKPIKCPRNKLTVAEVLKRSSKQFNLPKLKALRDPTTNKLLDDAALLSLPQNATLLAE
ncbi:hypothetical protein Pelo_3882 [Pelomyxa schiedti]|nr:hypothetical protein Pelo_3882 [Pelomyxa schiedti]